MLTNGQVVGAQTVRAAPEACGSQATCSDWPQGCGFLEEQTAGGQEGTRQWRYEELLQSPR